MSNSKRFRPTFHRFGRIDNLQTITATGASALNATEITNFGVTLIDSAGTGAGHTFTLAAPRKGVAKTIVVHGPGGSTLPANIQTNSSAVTVGESTGNRIVVSTTADTNGSVIQLIGQSSAAWLLGAPLPTGVTIAAATNL